jgi:CRISPR-associated endonuclease/helicase Cas3
MWKSFTEFFRAATGGRDPYPYQERFATEPPLPHLLRAPTGAGKTATAILGWLWRLRNPKQFPDTPRRLVYCLPMRVLVEQSFGAALGCLHRLGVLDAQPGFDPDDPKQVAGYRPRLDSTAAGRVAVHVLMGGSEAGDWHLHPERPAVLIGTQDMLLSRALNRGYAASRFHWPIDFGLLNNDCLWVFDEPQLMASGVSTSAQLAGLRKSLDTFGGCPSVWMSATLEPTWLDTIDFSGKFTAPPLELGKDDYDPKGPLHKRMTAAKTLGKLNATVSKDMKDVAKAVLAAHEAGTQMLVVLNTVDRAKAVYAAIKKDRSAPKNVLLVHSRFRPHERQRLNEQLQDKGEAAKDRIIVATQVVEAGVDISARTLVTELAPWASVVQRIGRCNRTGDDGPGRVFWIDSSAKDPEKKEDRQAALPYSVEDLVHARNRLNELDGKDVSPRSLTPYKLDPAFPHRHVVRRRDLLDLFDTSPDLSGNDIDVSRYVRGDDPDTDVQVFWRDAPPDNSWDARERRRQAARREELCNVPIGSFKDDFLKAGKTAWRFDHLDGEWREIGKKDIGSVVPGQTFWVVADQGGYDAELGWSPSAGRLSETLVIQPPDEAPKGRRERPEGYYDSDEWAVQREWRTLAGHTDDVVRELAAILDQARGLPLADELRTVLMVAARWHDWGKAHPVFQSGITDVIVDPKTRNLPEKERRACERPEKWRGKPFIAKAPDEFWTRYTRNVPGSDAPVPVKRFRHELASALGVLALEREGKLPPDWSALAPRPRWLALYLIASHHGKVRLSIRTMPDERPIPHDADKRRFAAGIWDDDGLPGTALDGAGAVSPPSVELSLETMQLGGDASWSAAALALRDELGPFRLAYLEALLRAADCRASGDLGEGGTSDV